VLAGVGFLHALGTVFVLSLIRFLVGVPLFLALEGYADQTQQAALALVQVILAPFLFVGLVVLYTETVARHERDDVPRRRPR
jgi:heme/copper-type cytochrome/quinol oxidase subunit 4